MPADSHYLTNRGRKCVSKRAAVLGRRLQLWFPRATAVLMSVRMALSQICRRFDMVDGKVTVQFSTAQYSNVIIAREGITSCNKTHHQIILVPTSSKYHTSHLYLSATCDPPSALYPNGCYLQPGLQAACALLEHFPSIKAGLCSLTSTESDCLAVFLQFGNQLVALAHDVLILLVLVVWPVGFDDALA